MSKEKKNYVILVGLPMKREHWSSAIYEIWFCVYLASLFLKTHCEMSIYGFIVSGNENGNNRFKIFTIKTAKMSIIITINKKTSHKN